MSGRGRKAGWAWGALALTALAAAVLVGVRVLPGLKVGQVDPAGAVIGLVALAVALLSLQMAARARRPPEPAPAEAADRLARVVAESETTVRRQLLGGHDKAIDVAFDFLASPAHPAAGARRRSHLTEVVDYYRRLSPRRLVITGAPGGGKTVLAVELILGLIEARRSGDPVPVRVSAASLDSGLPVKEAVEEWLRRHLSQVYQLGEATIRALVSARLVIPVIDGLDEMDADERPGYVSRAGHVLRAVNDYQDQRVKGAVVLTCRTAQYQALQELRIWAQDAAQVGITPVDARQARAFLTVRAVDPARWEPVLTAVRRAPRGPLARALSTPWRLTLAATVYDQRDPGGAFVRDPAELTRWATPEAVRDHLLALLVPALSSLHPPPDGITPERARRWLATLAGYLNRNTETGRTVGGRPLSGTDLVLHELWPLAGARRLHRALIGGMTAIWMTGTAIYMAQSSIRSPLTILAGAGAAALISGPLAWWCLRRDIWPEPGRIALRPLFTDAGRLRLAGSVTKNFGGLSVLAVLIISVITLLNPVEGESRGGLVVGLVSGVAAGLLAGLTVWLVVGLRVGVTIGFVRGLLAATVTGVAAGTGFGAATGVPIVVVLGFWAWAAPSLAIGLPGAFLMALSGEVVVHGTVGVTDPRDVLRADLTLRIIGSLAFSLVVGLVFWFLEGIVASVAAWLVLGSLTLLVNGLVGVRYVTLLACTRRWSRNPLPWRLGRFLHWAHGAGLVRTAGIAYQFRHREVQDYLAAHPTLKD
ncbi:NACHT domain-containing protein [Nonomuraea lactucae]|uniref:NACHT domain-containing protein n=1 Tax=Nonomuraea lactucae TaxID=2249762 RepID=UPI000DE4D391|nr:hypothetical protein [Nonomuraea lactucae]